MKYYSDDPMITKAFNKTWLWIGLPFFGLMAATFIGGFWWIEQSGQNGNLYPPLIIFSGIGIPVVFCYFISMFWFNYYIVRVTNKAEFVRRAKRNMMMLPGTMNRILNKKGIQLESEPSHTRKPLGTSEIDDLLLTDEHLVVKNTKYPWGKIRDFRITGNVHRTGSDLLLIFKNDQHIQEHLYLNDPQKLEYLMDKYLIAARK